MVDHERVDKMQELYGFPPEYVIDKLENDELNHASSCYFLLDVSKEYWTNRLEHHSQTDRG